MCVCACVCECVCALCMCMCVRVCVCARARVVCACMCTCVFVNCVWILSSKHEVFMERNSSVWDDAYHSAGKQRYGSRVEVRLVEIN